MLQFKVDVVPAGSVRPAPEPQRLSCWLQDRLDVATRLLPASAHGAGGDWCDVVAVGERHVAFAVGDVAGHGPAAAPTMRCLRSELHREAAKGRNPGAVLEHLGDLLDVGRDGRLATAVCGCLDVISGSLAIANAGHLPPVLIDGYRRSLVQTAVGPPLGVGARYATVHLSLPPGATLLLVTDGLVERRHESLARGLERLRRASRPTRSLDGLLDEVLAASAPGPCHDDIAMLALRWGARDR